MGQVFLKEFRKKRKFHKMTSFFCGLGGGFLGYATFQRGAGWAFIVFIILMAIGLLISYFFWKCPFCKENLSILTPLHRITSCKKCGAKFIA